MLTVEQFRAKFCKGVKATTWDENDKSQWILLSKGAGWGDLHVFTCEEIAHDLPTTAKTLRDWTKPKTKKAILIPFVKIWLAEDCPANIIDSIEDDERPPPIWRPEEHGYCLLCNFKVHPNPPPHFTPEMRKHCCGYCLTTKGRAHGGHCFQCV
jgi:hypothetical protein